MSDPIALITNIRSGIRSHYEASYLSVLASAVPPEKVILYRQMSAEQHAHVVAA